MPPKENGRGTDKNRKGKTKSTYSQPSLLATL
jgi:hypothetical protein